MSDNPWLKYTFYVTLFVSAAATLIVMGIMPLFNNGSHHPGPADSAAKSSTEHDATNSDGHHDKSNSDLGQVTDLTAQSEVAIDIKDFKYSKDNIKIKKGTTVTWTNRDAIKHNVMIDHQDGDLAHDAPTKEEVKPDVLAGQMLAQDESYTFTFNQVSTSPYHCSPHPYMKGSVTVVE